MAGLYRRGGKNTTSEECDKLEEKILEFKTRSYEVVEGELLDIINECTERAYKDGLKGK